LLFSLGLKAILWILPAAVYIVWHDRQNPLTVMKINTGVHGRMALIGSLVSLAYLSGIVLFEFLTTGHTFHSLFATAPLTVLVALAANSFSSFIEEVFFRGFVLSRLNESLGFWLANLIQGFLFVAIHWPNWIWEGGVHWNLLITSAGILLLALLLGWLVRRTNSIWPGVVVHIANNFISAYLA